MKKHSVMSLVIIVLVVALIAVLAFGGASFGKYRIKPLYETIKLGLDLTGGVSAVYEAEDLNDPELAANLDMAKTVFRTRLDSEGFPEATISDQGTGRIRIEIPINETSQVKDPNEITQYLVATARVSFVEPDGTVVFEGSDMESVYVSRDEAGQPAVAFKLNSDAAARFAEATGRLIGQPIAIRLDDNEISAPTVNSVIADGSGIISGGFDDAGASRLANQLRSGVMPIPLIEIEVRSISATLGDEALSKGAIAGVIAIIIVMLFMAAIYKLSGVVADIALVIYAVIIFFAMATIEGVQLTLPGIAGIILALGMAVDANVIIFERLGEELSAGKSLRTAVQNGFGRAFSAILDSNVTTIIAALVLMFFGTGPIKGFSYTLLIGIITSFVTAVFVTRGILTLFISIWNKPSLYCRKLTAESQKEAK